MDQVIRSVYHINGPFKDDVIVKIVKYRSDIYYIKKCYAIVS